MKNSSKIGFRPLEDRVLVKRDQLHEEVKLGIIIPDTAKEKPIKGTVVAAGTGKSVVSEGGKVEKLPMTVKEGDVVLFGKWSGTEVKINDEEYLIMKESDILGIVE